MNRGVCDVESSSWREFVEILAARNWRDVEEEFGVSDALRSWNLPNSGPPHTCWWHLREETTIKRWWTSDKRGFLTRRPLVPLFPVWLRFRGWLTEDINTGQSESLEVLASSSLLLGVCVCVLKSWTCDGVELLHQTLQTGHLLAQIILLIHLKSTSSHHQHPDKQTPFNWKDVREWV